MKKNSLSGPIRTAIQRKRAKDYLLVTLLSFALSVSLTRSFLYLTGYPQLGGGELHIAHVLWGGLLLFISALIPLILTNQWALMLSAAITGFGVGLFIDEVGKFITQSNDYFYPSAAPIIYAFFLLTVLLYVSIRKPAKPDTRSQLYSVLSDLEEILDRDLSEQERQSLLERLQDVKLKSSDASLVELSRQLEQFLSFKDLHLAPENPPMLEKLRAWWFRSENKFFIRPRHRAILIGGLLALAAWALVAPFQVFLSVRDVADLTRIVNNLLTQGLVHNPSGLTFFQVRIGIEGVTGLVLFAAAILLMIGKEKLGISLGYATLLVALTVANLIVFYFDQFSTIFTASLQFLILAGIIRYRQRFLDPKPHPLP
jgi:hypothetical protein